MLVVVTVTEHTWLNAGNDGLSSTDRAPVLLVIE